jgi:hypothetical protein
VHCNGLDCGEHGAVSAANGMFECVVCVPSIVLRGRGGPPDDGGGDGGGGGGGGGGGPPAPARREQWAPPTADTREWLALRFPEFVARSRHHAGPIEPFAKAVLSLARMRWLMLTGERIDAPVDLVAPLVGMSLWAGGLAAGNVPSYLPGTEGPLLRRNPLVGGLLYGQRRVRASDAEVAAQVRREIRRLAMQDHAYEAEATSPAAAPTPEWAYGGEAAAPPAEWGYGGEAPAPPAEAT